jgi:phosphopantothenoylcysteine decarboxylase / phosphopantothenate---cysteine ligase
VKVALGVTGGISAYKAIEVMRGLQKSGISVQAVLTRSARRFVTPLTFEALSAQPVITDMFARRFHSSIEHIQMAQEIQLLAIVPATANMLGKFAGGLADDFLSTLYLSCPAPVLLAPAMNVHMWRHPAVQHNIAILKARGHHFVDPEEGELACGMQGEGRLAAVDTIISRIQDLLASGGSLAGLKVLVTAGPTVEDLDPVRFLSNRSSGKMGYAVAQAAILRGAEVVLVSGPTDLFAPSGVRHVSVRSAAEMKAAVLENYTGADIVVMAAAVADYRPRDYAAQKIKKEGRAVFVELVPTDDILALLGKEKKNQMLIGFAAETEDLLARSRNKLRQKNLDMIVANDVSSGVFGADSATVLILTPDGEAQTLRGSTKLNIAHSILQTAIALRTARRAQTPPSTPLP